VLLFTQKITAIRNFVKNVCFDTWSSKFLRALSVLPNITDIAAKRKEKREREKWKSLGVEENTTIEYHCRKIQKS